ncbi:Asp23/Gls24 family envelope stress response protein [Jatrophihabitans fulvus]
MTAADPGAAAAIAAAVLTVDDVVAMSSGPHGQFRSYLGGGASVPGVRVDDEHVELNVVARWGDLGGLGARVATALGTLTGGRPVTVTVEDVLLPGEPAPAPRPVVDPADSQG